VSERGADPILSVRDLDASYGPVQILFGLDLDVYDGEIVALLGTNGAGKSTLFKCITNLLEPSAGSVVFDGQELRGMRTDEIAAQGVVMMPGGKSVFPTLTVRDNLRLACWMKRRDPVAVREAEERVLDLFPRLGDRIDQLAGNLSGGEQQMLAVSQALIPDPKLLLIDELSLGLAPTVVGQLIDVVQQIHATGLTIVVVEQSINVALRLAERAVFMEKGEFRFTGSTEELLDRPDILRSVFIAGASAGAAASPPRSS
jgi:branched-chain amino acid transport system ATP-binding protein